MKLEDVKGKCYKCGALIDGEVQCSEKFPYFLSVFAECEYCGYLNTESDFDIINKVACEELENG